MRRVNSAAEPPVLKFSCPRWNFLNYITHFQRSWESAEGSLINPHDKDPYAQEQVNTRTLSDAPSMDLLLLPRLQDCLLRKAHGLFLS